MESIHGHEVMKMMVEADRSFSKEELEGEINERFGKDARFHTCSAQDMTARELIGLLEKKGKFIESEHGISTSKDRICNH